jgi:hypothetical protein
MPHLTHGGGDGWNSSGMRHWLPDFQAGALGASQPPASRFRGRGAGFEQAGMDGAVCRQPQHGRAGEREKKLPSIGSWLNGWHPPGRAQPQARLRARPDRAPCPRPLSRIIRPCGTGHHTHECPASQHLRDAQKNRWRHMTALILKLPSISRVQQDVRDGSRQSVVLLLQESFNYHEGGSPIASA